MSIANALICAVLFYGFLVLLGRATIALCRQQFDPLETHAISPVIGLAVLTLLTTYLSFLNIPLGMVSKNIVLGSSILATITLASRPIHDFKNNGPLTCFGYLVPLLVTAVFVALPFIMGGYQFVILRGNGTDAFNYVAMADGLSRYPLDWILTQTKETLAAQSPNLPLLQELVKTRWSTSALLGFVSSALGISPIEFEYAYTLTLLVTLFNALVGALYSTCTLTRLTIWLPVFFVVGFWGQFTLDIRAFSQITSLPILVTLVGWLLASNTSNKDTIFRYGVTLTAILSTALFFQYPEIVVAFLPGAGLIFLLRLWKTYRENTLSKIDLIALVVFSLATLILCAPLIKFMLGFAFDQGLIAISKSPPGWNNAFFEWMGNPIRGLWGIGINPGFGLLSDNLFGFFAFFIAIILTIVTLVRIGQLAILHQQWQLNVSESRLFLLAISGLVGAIVLFAKENPWAAGKVISYFSILIPIWMAIVFSNKKLNQVNSRLNKTSHWILSMAILGWCLINLVIAGFRITHAINGSDFPGYIISNGFYRRANIEPITRLPFLNCPLHSTVTIFEPNPATRDFLTLLFEGQGFKTITPGFPTTRGGLNTHLSYLSDIYCAVVDRKYFDASSIHAKNMINPIELVTQQPLKDYVGLIDFEGGYGVNYDINSTTIGAWTGHQDLRLSLLASASTYIVTFKLCPGPSKNDNKSITVFVEADGKLVSQHIVQECIDMNVELVGNNKIQQIRLISADPQHKPTLSDELQRDLRLYIEITGVRLKDGAL
jgi:hypothetical protein